MAAKAIFSKENLSITLRNFEHTEAIDAAVREHVLKLEIFLSANAHIHWVCWSDKKEFYCEVTIKDDANSLYACAHTDNFYKTIDTLTHRLKSQLSRKKEYTKERIHHRRNYALSFAELGQTTVPLFPS